MKYAILGDIHSNLEALEAVLEDASDQGVEDYLCVGDIVGYGANPAECLERIRALTTVNVRGNHDHYVCHKEDLGDMNPAAADVVLWTRQQLSESQLSFLRQSVMVKSVNGFTVVHSTLDMPEKWGYVLEELEALASFTYQTTPVCFHGHTHVPVVYEKSDRVRRSFYEHIKIQIGRKYFINVGSVGQPRDGDPRAAYVVYDADVKDVVLRRVAYDIRGAQEKIRAAGLPEGLALRLAVGK